MPYLTPVTGYQVYNSFSMSQDWNYLGGKILKILPVNQIRQLQIQHPLFMIK